MGEDGGGATDGNGGEEPVSPADVAAYIHEIAGALVIAARGAGLTEIADTLAKAQSQSAALLPSSTASKRRRKSSH